MNTDKCNMTFCKFIFKLSDFICDFCICFVFSFADNCYAKVVSLLKLASGILTGKYDAATKQAVKDFQTVNRLPPDGRVDRITWNRLAESQIRAVNEYGME